jgi:Dyp-type peroxidase family
LPHIVSALEAQEFRVKFRAARARLNGVKPKNMVQTLVNVGFSFDALKALAGPTAEQFNENHPAFSIGLPQRSALLGDPTETESPYFQENWQVGAMKNPDIILKIGSDDEAAVDRLVNSIITSGAQVVTKEYVEKGVDLGGFEHFGSRDGIVQPALRGKYFSNGGYVPFVERQLHTTDPRYNRESHPGRTLVWPGEMLLGYHRNSVNHETNPGELPLIKPPWAKNGSFLVFRRLEQDVALYRQVMSEFAATLRTRQPSSFHWVTTPTAAGALILGRWPSGAPLMRSPQADNCDMGALVNSNNAFKYHNATEAYKMADGSAPDGWPLAPEDAHGVICPFASHIRKVHTRDEENSFLSLRRMITRRGVPYGPPLNENGPIDEQQRGLLFLCYQSSIEDGFEFIQRFWSNNPNFAEPDIGYDLVIGQKVRGIRDRFLKVKYNEEHSIELTTANEWVHPTGGGYFFTPSLFALKYIIAAPRLGSMNA